MVRCLICVGNPHFSESSTPRIFIMCTLAMSFKIGGVGIPMAPLRQVTEFIRVTDEVATVCNMHEH